MKKENKGLIILVVILLIAAVVVGAFVGYKRAAQNDKKNDIDSKSVAKLDESKDYVYDADYTESYNNIYTEYDFGEHDEKTFSSTLSDDITVEIKTSGIFKLSDYKIPYININSYDAGHANGELVELYKKYAQMFDESILNKDHHDVNRVLTYRTFKYENILSIVVIETLSSYKTYNFDLKTGNEITYDEMITRLGYDKNTLLDKEKEVIKKEMDKINTFNYDLTKTCGNVDEPKNCYDQAYEKLEKSIKDNSLQFFANDKGELNFVAIPNTGLYQNSENDKKIFTIEK